MALPPETEGEIAGLQMMIQILLKHAKDRTKAVDAIRKMESEYLTGIYAGRPDEERMGFREAIRLALQQR